MGDPGNFNMYCCVRMCVVWQFTCEPIYIFIYIYIYKTSDHNEGEPTILKPVANMSAILLSASLYGELPEILVTDVSFWYECVIGNIPHLKKKTLSALQLLENPTDSSFLKEFTVSSNSYMKLTAVDLLEAKYKSAMHLLTWWTTWL
jgi:hypothetical protein